LSFDPYYETEQFLQNAGQTDLQGGPIHALINLDLKSADHRSAVMTQHDFSTLKPGYALAGP
jgi:hypothetical protein